MLLPRATCWSRPTGKLRGRSRPTFPAQEILAVSARTGANLEAWFSRLTGESQSAKTAMKVDYEIYADGEAMLGWLNCTVQLRAGKPFAGRRFSARLAGEVQSAAARLAKRRSPISK